MDATILDLRGFFTDPSGVRDVLASLDAVWVVGGNTYVLARAMHASGFAQAITALLHDDEIAYAGYSAGACIAGPDLRGIHVLDEPELVPSGYDSTWPTNSLGLIPWRIVPHWRSDHDESPAADNAVEFLLSEHLPFQTLSDG